MGLVIQIILYLEKVTKYPSLVIFERTNLFQNYIVKYLLYHARFM